MWEIDFCRSIPYYSDQTPLSNAKLCQVYIRWASSSFIHPSVALCLRLAVCPSARLPVLHENRKPGTSLRSSTGSWCAPTSSKYRPLERRRRHREGQKGRAKGGANGGTIRHSVCVCVWIFRCSWVIGGLMQILMGEVGAGRPSSIIFLTFDWCLWDYRCGQIEWSAWSSLTLTRRGVKIETVDPGRNLWRSKVAMNIEHVWRLAIDLRHSCFRYRKLNQFLSIINRFARNQINQETKYSKFLTLRAKIIVSVDWVMEGWKRIEWWNDERGIEWWNNGSGIEWGRDRR